MAHDTHDPEEIDTAEEFVRLKGKFQIGDGPDARAEITVETTRVCRLEVDDEQKAMSGDRERMRSDWRLEVAQALATTRSELGLEPPERDA